MLLSYIDIPWAYYRFFLEVLTGFGSGYFDSLSGLGYFDSLSGLGYFDSLSGLGYFDSLSGLGFFMLLGRVFKMITYRYLAFDRDYKSFKNSFGMLGYGRWRMLHTNTVVFAFVVNIIFTGSYYSLQRLLKTRMFSDGSIFMDGNF